MDLVITLIIGALIGWAASLLMKTNAQQGMIVNIIIGIVGSSLGAWLFGDVLHIGGARTAGSVHVIGLLWGVLGACVLIGLLKLVRIFR